MLCTPGLAVPVTLPLAPFINKGSVVGTPSRYLGEFGPDAVDVIIVLADSVLTADGFTCQS